MRNSIAIFLAVILCASVFCMLTACKNNNVPATDAPATDVPATAEVPAGPVTGGWTIPQEPAEAEIPEEAKAAFDLAMESYQDGSPAPIAYLGSQVVAGVNYSFLCVDTTGLKQIKIYKDLEGNASILSEEAINIADYTAEGDISFPDPAMAGGWSASEASGAALPEDIQKAFDTAMAGLTGVGYEPIAVLGTQVVAGTNYAILCKATQVTADAPTALAVLTIYADLEGGATLTSVCGF